MFTTIFQKLRSSDLDRRWDTDANNGTLNAFLTMPALDMWWKSAAVGGAAKGMLSVVSMGLGPFMCLLYDAGNYNVQTNTYTMHTLHTLHT